MREDARGNALTWERKCGGVAAVTHRVEAMVDKAADGAQKGGMSDCDLENCACTGRTLHKLVRPFVLALLANGPAHGYALLEHLQKVGVAPTHSAVYRALGAMEKEGWVRSRKTPGSGGPTRWEYTLTQDGRGCLHRWVTSLRQHRTAINSLLKLIPPPSR